MKFLAGVVTVAAFAASSASAQTGWYGAVDLGWHVAGDMSTTSSANLGGAPADWRLSTDDDWGGFARLGYRMNDKWRVELELGYRGADFTGARGSASQVVPEICISGVTRTAAAPSCKSPAGDFSTSTGMVNVLYDFAPEAAISPFVGVGVGAARAAVDMTGQFSNVQGAITTANPAVQNFAIDDSDTALAYEGLAGLAWKVTDRVNVDLTYRYLATAGLDLASTGSNALRPGALGGKYKDQSLTFGLRYSLASPPPLPPPPPPPPLPLPPPPEPPPPAPPVFEAK